jgi:hypothetical protein
MADHASMRTAAGGSLYGLCAEFADTGALLAAAGRVYREGYRSIDAFSPAPIHGLAEAMGQDDRRLPKFTLFGGLTGTAAGYGLGYWVSVWAYPLNIGGRPLHSWPAFIIPAYETTILFASLATAIGMIIMCGLPHPYHPLFNVKRFREHATNDGLFLCVESTDPKFDRVATRQLLESLGAKEINEVEA